jgi:Kdo2-lipid IVA lauroyltransferase/acyltransferase
MKERKALDAVISFAFGAGQRLFMHRDIERVERRGRRLGDLIARVDKKHRKRTRENLRLAFPEWSEARVEEITRESFRHWGLVTADFLRTPIRTAEEVLEGFELRDRQHWDQARAEGKGILACTGHFGNFERFGHYSSVMGEQISVVAREANQGEIQRRMEALRTRAGLDFMGRGDAVRPILKKLRNNGIVGLLPDQNSSEAFVPFFGKPCGTVLGPAVLHLRTGAPILPAFCARTGPGKYLAFFFEPISGKSEPEALMTQFNRVLEAAIREFPEQYLWMHDRWKSARHEGLL